VSEMLRTLDSSILLASVQRHLRENLIHSRFNVSGTLLTLGAERADRQAGKEHSMQVGYFHKRNWLGVDSEDSRSVECAADDRLKRIGSQVVRRSARESEQRLALEHEKTMLSLCSLIDSNGELKRRR
jgi:hypothetical protein